MKKKNKRSIRELREEALKSNLQRRKEVKQNKENNDQVKLND